MVVLLKSTWRSAEWLGYRRTGLEGGTSSVSSSPLGAADWQNSISCAFLYSAFLCFLRSFLCSALVCSVSAQSPSLSCRCCRHVCAPGRDTHYTAVHITPNSLFKLQLFGGSATILHGPVEIRCVFTSMSWCWEGRGGETDRWIWMVLPSPLLPRPVNIRRSTEVGRTVIVLIIIWLKCWETLHSTSILMIWHIDNWDLF